MAVILDKPEGVTSSRAVGIVRRVLGSESWPWRHVGPARDRNPSHRLWRGHKDHLIRDAGQQEI